ncbi:phosphatidate cytidylyltransferase [uncultured Alistipes sp.]|uniref:phosphatidate cytidylyltransferase n=1 Tax=uncultured Alistipes sp. TaxID=538949 RepID=UPI0025CC68B1|nr:phosphatidate cytidylyltransferase [uncultured Alistipes sp.]
MSDKMKNLAVRTMSGLVLAAVVLGAIAWSQWSFGALLLVLLAVGMLEFYALAGKQGNSPQKIVGLVAGIVLFVLNFAFVSEDIEILGSARQAYGCGLAFLLLLLPAMFICELYRRNENPAAGIGTTMMGVCYVALPLSLMCYIPMVGSDTWNPWVMIAYIFIIWANDVFAYLVGMSIGRHRLCERLSPKKSWEGFFGGLAGAVVMGVVAAKVLDAHVWVWAGLALVAAVSGVLGDLVESMFKRAAGVKDSGKLIPGHGGVLDRFDAMLLSAPFVFVYMLFVM